MRDKNWYRNWHNLIFGCWNYNSFSNERLQFCKSLGFDVLALTELHNLQNRKSFESRRLIPSAQAEEVDEQGKLLDPAAGVAILLSARMAKTMPQFALPADGISSGRMAKA